MAHPATDRYMELVPVRDILRCIAALAASCRTVLIGIDGGAGAGKSTFTKWLAARLANEISSPVPIVLTDRIYRVRADRWQGAAEEMPIGYDLDWERIRDEILVPLTEGATARFRLYDWIEDRLGEVVEIEAGGVTIIDGVFALRRELADRYGLRVWLTCPLETRIARLLGRGDTSRKELDYWLPIEQRYHESHAPEECAHLVLDSAADLSAADASRRLKVRRWVAPRT